MDKETFISFLQSVCEEFIEKDFNSDGEQSFTASVYCKIPGEDYDAKCARFMEGLSVQTNTNWILYKRYGHLKRDLFRKTFKCQHSSFNKKKKERKYVNRMRNRDCEAAVDFRYKKVCRDVWKNDPILKTGLNCIIEINFTHNHSIVGAEAFCFLRCYKETIDTFCSYFDSGMTPSAAKKYHEMILVGNSKDKDDTLKANAHVNPTSRQVIHLFENWRKGKYREQNKDSVVDYFKKMKECLKESGFDLIIDEETMMTVVITPMMKGVFALEEANNIIFVVSSGSISCDNTCGTFIFSGSKVGALPLGCILHTALTEDCYLKGFNLLKQTLESNGNKTFSPEVILTDDNLPERSALQHIFPEAKLLLYNFHVSQDLWCWLWDDDHYIDKDDRKSIMEGFQQILDSESISIANDHYKNVLNSVETKYQNAKKYLEDLWERKNEWCFSYYEGNNNNNYCEASIRIFKDVVLQECKAFNFCALVDFICQSLEYYHHNRLTEFSNSKGDEKLQPHYAMFLKTSDTNEVIQQSECEFKVTTTGVNDVYTVNTKWLTCDCVNGRGGRYCEHMCAVEVKYNTQMTTCPVLTADEKLLFSKVALDQSVPEDFLKIVDAADDEIESMECENIQAENEYKTHNSSEHNDVSAISSKLRHELNRIVDIIESHPTSVNVSVLQKAARQLENIKTPAQVSCFLMEKCMAVETKKIRVQPVSTSRTKNLGSKRGRRTQPNLT